MIDSWSHTKLSNLCDITRGASPRPIHEWVATEGIPWVKISDASAAGSRFVNHTAEKVLPEAVDKSVPVFPGDLILSNSATPGIPMFMGIDGCIHDGWLLLRNFRRLDKLFAYYLLVHERSALVDQGNGSVFTNLNTATLKNHVVSVPPLSEQRAIAHILGTLDDKIELNRRMNDTLEAMAQAVFQDWFVDFGAVRAKLEGSDPYLPPELCALFPDRLVESELGELPEGWEVAALGDVADISSGKPAGHRSSTASGEVHIPLWGGNGPIGFVATALVDPPILLTGRVGTLGSVFRIMTPCWPSDNTLVVSAKSDEFFNYLFLQMERIDFGSLNRGSTQPLLTQSDLQMQPVIVPPEHVLRHFHTLTDPLFKGTDQNNAEAQSLAAQRDALLSKLVSGDIRALFNDKFTLDITQ